MRAELLENVRGVMSRAGFYVSRPEDLRSLSFDLIARRDGDLVLVKVLTNVDSVSEAAAHELKVLANFLEATALVVGERSSSRGLESGVVYARHGISIMTFETLEEHLLGGQPPLVYAAPGGFYANIDGERLRSIREQRGLSLGQLAEVAGVSRRAISMYEEGMSAMVDVAARLEEFLEEALVKPVDPFRFPREPHEAVVDLDRLGEGIEREVFQQMARMGFRVMPMQRGPFRAMVKQERVIVTGVANELPELQKSARAVANFCEVAETYGAFFVRHRKTREAFDGTPVIERRELEGLSEPEDILHLIRERRGKRR